jgi:hypothetical protein
VRGEAGIDHVAHGRVTGQEVGDPLGVVAMAIHPYAQRLQPAMSEEGIERAGDCAHGVLMEGDLLGQVEISYDQGAPDDVGVTADVFRRRMHHDVGTERQRLLEIGSREGVVDDQQGSAVVGSVGQCLDVTEVEQRVGGGLDPHQGGDTRLDRRPHCVDVTHRRRIVLDPPRLGDLVEEPERSAVRIVGQHHVVPRTAQCADQGVLGRQSTREREAALALLDRRQCALERRPRRVGGAAVFIAAPQASDTVLFVGRRREDRRDHRTRGGVRLIPGVDRAGVEAGLVAVLCVG